LFSVFSKCRYGSVFNVLKNLISNQLCLKTASSYLMAEQVYFLYNNSHLRCGVLRKLKRYFCTSAITATISTHFYRSFYVVVLNLTLIANHSFFCCCCCLSPLPEELFCSKALANNQTRNGITKDILNVRTATISYPQSGLCRTESRP